MSTTRRYARRLLTGLLAASLWLGVGYAAQPAAQSSGVVPAHPVSWGVFLPDDSSGSSALSVVTQMAGAPPRYLLQFAAIDDPVPFAKLGSAQAAGALPILTLEMWQPPSERADSEAQSSVHAHPTSFGRH